MDDYEQTLSELNYSQFNSTASWNHTVLLQWLRRHRHYYEHELVPDECFPLLDILDLFHLYYIPAIILVGLVGNLLSCIVFLNTHLKMRSSSYYLAALATADFGFLATLMMVWLNNNLGVQKNSLVSPFDPPPYE
ncbi:G-protein coupled receptor activity protein [Homalodisca vitripennis]|nr:G-protein coupled receptor activity protein [Homalodisca vitripennis]